MKLYGYKEGNNDAELIELSDVSLVASPEELRKISNFIRAAANDMEQLGDGFDHEHLSDNLKDFDDSPQFMVCRPQEID